MTRLAPGHRASSMAPARLARSLGRRAWPALKLAQVRLRVPIVLVVAALVIGRWEVIRNYWDRLTRGTVTESVALHAVSADTEYFCPMDPGVLSGWPGKCGVCNMALVRRKKGEAVALPDGTMARMQISPYRIQLAGIQTAPASFCRLMRVVRERDAVTVRLEIPARQAPWIEEGQTARVSCAELAGRDPMAARVQAVDRLSSGAWEDLRVTVAVIDPPRSLPAGMIVVVRVMIPVAELEPFRSVPADPPRLTPAEPRQVFACPDHGESIMVEAGRCPLDQKPRELRPLSEFQRLLWWCPMHPAVTADVPGGECKACGGMVLVPRLISYRPAGQVLAVPQSAVIDAGARKVVFVEGMPGMFDGVEVVVGPRCGDLYPVVRGLEPGAHVVVAGAFLLDAETRLNPSLAGAYFGAGRGERSAAAARLPETSQTNLSGSSPSVRELAPDDRALAERQKVCPVTKKPLGSMGTPKRIVVSGQMVLLCCDGCEDALRRDPARYLTKRPSP
jgi:hypothetical protein